MKRLGFLLYVLGLGVAQAAVMFQPAGTGYLSFDATPGASEWATRFVPGTASSFSLPADLDAAVQTNIASSFMDPVLPEYFSSPVPHTISSWSAARRSIYTGPAGAAANLLMTTLRNNTGTTIFAFYVGYDQDVFPVTQSTPEEIPGQRVFFSLTGLANTWQPIPELTGNTSIGLHQAVITVGSWLPGTDLYLLWAQDNAVHSPDACYLIDNFFAGPEPPPPPCFATHPSSVAVNEGEPATFAVTPCSNPPYYYQWYRNGLPIPGATNSSYNMPHAHPSQAGTYYVVLSNSVASLSSGTATLSVVADVTAPVAALAYISSSPFLDTIRVQFSERVDVNRATAVTNYFLSSSSPASTPMILGITMTNEMIAILHVENLSSNVGYQLLVREVTDQSDAAHVLIPNPTMLAVQTFGPPVVHDAYVWRYFEAPTNTTWPGWQNVDYDDSTWLSGPGAFGLPFDEIIPAPFVMRTVIRPSENGGPITTYFRASFNLSASNTNAMIQLRGVFDEGAVAYVNGTEVWRVRMPNGPITTSTLSSNATEPHVLAGPLDLYAPGLLRPGSNVVAVELHQVTPVSGDAVMGLILGVSQETSSCVPLLSIVRSGPNGVTVTWTCEGILQVAPMIVPHQEFWHDVLTSNKSLTTNLNYGMMFFRIRP